MKENNRGPIQEPDVDTHIGSRIRDRRISLGLSQADLGGLIGVSYQQVHKLERGLNRASAGALVRASRALLVPVSYFFEGLEAPREESKLGRFELELCRLASSITDEAKREALSRVARVLAA